MQLGELGVWTSYRAIGEENAGEAAKLVEDLGFGTFWLGGSPQLPALLPPLQATDRFVVGSGILNVKASEPDGCRVISLSLRPVFPPAPTTSACRR